MQSDPLQLALEKGLVAGHFKMPTGRKSGKSSAGQAKSSSKTATTSNKAAPAATSTLVAEIDENCQQALNLCEPDNDLDDAKLSELSAYEPESSECELENTAI